MGAELLGPHVGYLPGDVELLDGTIVFNSGQGNGDTISDFVGNGAGLGDQFQVVGYGTAAQGAAFTQVDITHRSINSFVGLVHEIITDFYGVSIHASDCLRTLAEAIGIDVAGSCRGCKKCRVDGDYTRRLEISTSGLLANELVERTDSR